MTNKIKSKIYLGSDHAGFALKQNLMERLSQAFIELEFVDLGCSDESSVDYPDYAKKVGEAVAREQARGILVCGSGIGVAIAANKVRGIRAATVWDVTSAQLSREHNYSNVICLGARLSGPEVAFQAASSWLKSEFAGGRHQKRIDLISNMEKPT